MLGTDSSQLGSHQVLDLDFQIFRFICRFITRVDSVSRPLYQSNLRSSSYGYKDLDDDHDHDNDGVSLRKHHSALEVVVSAPRRRKRSPLISCSG